MGGGGEGLERTQTRSNGGFEAPVRRQVALELVAPG